MAVEFRATRSAWCSASSINHEVDVRIWIHPEHRQKGYGTAAMRQGAGGDGVVFPRGAVAHPGAGRRDPLSYRKAADTYLISPNATMDGWSGNSKPLSADESGALCTVDCQPRSAR